MKLFNKIRKKEKFELFEFAAMVVLIDRQVRDVA